MQGKICLLTLAHRGFCTTPVLVCHNGYAEDEPWASWHMLADVIEVHLYLGEVQNEQEKIQSLQDAPQ